MDTVVLVRYLYQKEGVEVSVEITEGEIFVNGIIGELQQVLLNLLKNAKDSLIEKKLSQKKEISISLDKNGFNKVILKIKDTGNGIPVEIQEKILDPFFTSKAPGKGTGLGLCLVNNFISKIGGRLEFESEVGKGTTFLISLPVIDPTHKK